VLNLFVIVCLRFDECPFDFTRYIHHCISYVTSGCARNDVTTGALTLRDGKTPHSIVSKSNANTSKQSSFRSQTKLFVLRERSVWRCRQKRQRCGTTLLMTTTTTSFLTFLASKIIRRWIRIVIHRSTITILPVDPFRWSLKERNIFFDTPKRCKKAHEVDTWKVWSI